MLTFAQEIEALTIAVANDSSEKEERRLISTVRSARICKKNQARIVKFMVGKGPLEIKTICESVQMKRATVYNHLQRLIVSGRVTCLPRDTNHHSFVLGGKKCVAS